MRVGGALGSDQPAGEAAQAGRDEHAVARGQGRDPGPHGHHGAGRLGPRHEGHRRLDLILPGHEEGVDVVHPRRLHGHRNRARSGLGVGPVLDHQEGGWPELVADDGAHGRSRYRRPVVDIRSARPDELALLPPARGGGRHPLRRARHRTPAGAVRRGGPRRSPRRPGGRRPAAGASPASRPWPAAPISSSSRSTRTMSAGASAVPSCAPPSPGRPGTATTSSPWPPTATFPGTGPSTRRRVSSRLGPADDWYAARGLPPEEPVMGRFGARVLMARRLP